MRHYRHERAKRTLCGLRIALDGKPRSRPIRGPKGEVVGRREEPTTNKQPRVLPRVVSWLPEMNTDDDVVRGLPPWADCPFCVAEGRKQIEEARTKAQGGGNSPRQSTTAPDNEKRWLADAHRAAEESGIEGGVP